MAAAAAKGFHAATTTGAKMTMRKKEPGQKHKAFRDALMAVANRYDKDIDAQDLLAIFAHTVGQLAALQDHRTMTPQMAIELIIRNIEIGNQQAIADLQHVEGKPN